MVSAIGRLLVGHVQLVEVDVVGAEPGQAVLDGRAHVGGATPPLVTLVGCAELGGQHDLVAPRPERGAEVRLALGAAVDVGGVEEGDAGIERGADDGSGLGCGRCRPPKLLQPRPTTLTVSDPIVRVSIGDLPPIGGSALRVRNAPAGVGQESAVLYRRVAVGEPDER